MPTVAVQLGEELAEARQKSGFSVGELAAATGLSRSVLYDAERGRRVASRDVVENYAKACARPDLIGLREQRVAELSLGDPEPGLAAGRLITRIDQLLSSPPPPPGRSAKEWTTRHESLLSRLGAGQIPKGHEVVYSRVDTLRLATRLMASAAVRHRSGVAPREPILLALLGQHEPPVEKEDVADDWRTALCLALDVGLDVVDIRCLQQGAAQQVALVNDLVGFLGKRGNYEPRQLAIQEDATLPRDIMVFPGIGALQFFTVDQSRYPDAGYFFNETDFGDICRLLAEHAEQLKAAASPIVRQFDRTESPQLTSSQVSTPADQIDFESRIELESAMLEAERLDGPRFLIKDGLSTVTCPIAVAAARIRRQIEQYPADSDAQRFYSNLLKLREERQRAFLEQIKRHEFVDVVPESALRPLLQDRPLL